MEHHVQRPMDSPLRNEAMARAHATDSPNSSDTHRKVGRVSGTSDRSVEQSPLHPRTQTRASSGGQTPGRIKTKTGGRGDESPDRGPAVPPFGEWEQGNPAAADSYTGIFDKVRIEKQTGSAKVPIITDDTKYLNSFHQDTSYQSSACGCFSWCKK